MGNDVVFLYIFIEFLKYKQSGKKIRMVLVFCYYIFVDFKKLFYFILWKCICYILREFKYVMICQIGIRIFWSWVLFSDILGVMFCFYLMLLG